MAGTVIAWKMTAMDQRCRDVEEALHAGDIVMAAIVDQRAVIDDIAGEQDEGCSFPRSDESGLGCCATSEAVRAYSTAPTYSPRAG